MTEFDDVIRRLRDERPEATPLELDQIKQRVRRNAARGSRRSQPMKSRLAILATLVVGMLFTTAGAGVAVTSVVSDTNAANQQYGGGTAPEKPVIPSKPETPSKPSGGVQGETNTKPKPAAAQPTTPAAVQPARQVEVGATAPATTVNTGSELPFTGFAAIPVLLIGIALLTTGVVLRKRAGEGA
jgi:hypothetical protein